MTDNSVFFCHMLLTRTYIVPVWDVKGEFVQGMIRLRPFQQLQVLVWLL